MLGQLVARSLCVREPEALVGDLNRSIPAINTHRRFLTISMLLVPVDDLIKHLPFLPGDKLYKLYVAPDGFAMIAKMTPEGWLAYRMGTYQFFGANKEVMQYREFAGIRRNAELFEIFVARYQT